MNDNTIQFIQKLFKENSLIGSEIDVNNEFYYPLYKLKISTLNAGIENDGEYISIEPIAIISSTNKEILMKPLKQRFDFKDFVNDKTIGIFDQITKIMDNGKSNLN